LRNGLKAVVLSEDKADFVTVVAASKGPKRKNLLTMRDTGLGAYDTYVSELSSTSLKPIAMTKPVHASYYSLYDGTGPAIKNLKEYLKVDAEATCLFCALNEFDSLDHYLPRAVFPEFSMSSRNLVPICTVCNRDWKKQMWGGEKLRPFLHPYIDNLAAYDYLVCDVSIVSNALLIRFSIDSSKISDLILKKVFENHFANLGLATRFRKRTQKEDVDDLIRCMQGKATVIEKEAALISYIEPLLQNKRDHRLLAFYKGIQNVANQIAAVQWTPV
jgi:hypothetical protein